jgi:allantoinase
MFDCFLRNAVVVRHSELSRGDVAIVDGKIVEIGLELSGQAHEEIDCTGLHLIPGLIDTHVHFNDPGRAEWEGVSTGSAALVAGGGTCYFDMPLNASPPTLDAASFRLKRDVMEASSWADFGLWGGLVPGNLDRLEELAAAGAVGFKAFMSNSGIDDFLASDDFTLWQGMQIAGKLGLPVAVHAESDAITGGLARAAVAAGRTSVRDYLASRPVMAELEAIDRAIRLADDAGCALHIVHVSTGHGVAIVAAARAEGIDVTCETCPHYLVLTAADVERLGAVAKCAPPLRSETDRDELWKAVERGDVELIASDHSPAPQSMKQSTNFFEIWGGIAGVQTTLGLMLAEGLERRGMSLARLMQMLSTRPAERYGLPNKGRIEVDADADLTLVDLSSSHTLEAGELRYRHAISPYLGRKLTGNVRRVIVRGQTVLHDGQFVGSPSGQLVQPVPGAMKHVGGGA